jgi:DNA-directed RNA polymerase sigma subunit (sigma70/sigma32)
LPLPDRDTGPQAVRSTQLSWLVAHAARDLDEEELLVVVLRYFMGRQQQPMPRNEVATLLGMRDERYVRNVEARALRKLRGAVRAHYRPWDETSDSETGDHDARDRGANH